MLLWRVDIQLRVVSFSLNHVDAIINEGRDILGNSLGFMVLLKHQIVIFHGTSFVVLIPNLIFLGYV